MQETQHTKTVLKNSHSGKLFLLRHLWNVMMRWWWRFASFSTCYAWGVVHEARGKCLKKQLMMHESVDNHLNRDYALVKCNLFVQVFVWWTWLESCSHEHIEPQSQLSGQTQAFQESPPCTLLGSAKHYNNLQFEPVVVASVSVVSCEYQDAEIEVQPYKRILERVSWLPSASLMSVNCLPMFDLDLQDLQKLLLVHRFECLVVVIQAILHHTLWTIVPERDICTI